MGAPREVRLFSVKEMSELLSLARNSAVRFRTTEARAEALERFRLAILPLTDWLDKPIKECFAVFDEEMYRHAPTKRALPVFCRYGNNLHVVALDRRGDWITIERNPSGKYAWTKLTSSELAAKVEQKRFVIMDSIPWPRSTTHLKTIESLGLETIITHCAFLKYIRRGVEEMSKVLAEREQRMQIMRGNLTFLTSFVAGLDPLIYETRDPIPTYAVFNKHPKGTSRCSGTYFIRNPVQAQVDERNARQRVYPDMSYYVYDSHARVDGLGSFLDSLYYSMEEIKETMSSDARKPISKEEAAVIKGFADSIGNA